MLPKVYPRVCGGTQRSVSSIVATAGLSPRVRGNRQKRSGLRMVMRSIPACAGEPICRGCGGSLAEVYPRVCGGTAVTAPAAMLY